MSRVEPVRPGSPGAGWGGGLSTVAARIAYDDRVVCEGLDLSLAEGELTVVIGPNASGKSTVLRALARLLRPRTGQVLLDGADLYRMRTRDVARRLGLLPQSAVTPTGITVTDLVRRGRYPHQSFLSRWSREDERSVAAALAATGMTELGERVVDELSGGQRQRAWVAMALAQESPLLLLDEPTTFLDVNHQITLLDLFAHLNATTGRTMVAVLHDINHAARYASQLVVMKEGRVVAHGPPAEVLTVELLADVFDIEAVIVEDPVNSGPLIVTRHRARPT